MQRSRCCGGVILNWRHPGHWLEIPKVCGYCGWLTHLRDSKGRPAHKVCAERALEQQAAELAEDRAAGLM